VIITAITSRIDRILIGDHLIADWQIAGLLFPSVVTAVVRTIKQDMVNKKLGSLSIQDSSEADKKLKLALGLI
jgi:mRNA interferase MazF